jgi:hypothetical protein
VDRIQLDKLADLVVQRLTLAQNVAATKYASGEAIDDSIRELEIPSVGSRRSPATMSGLQLAKLHRERDRLCDAVICARSRNQHRRALTQRAWPRISSASSSAWSVLRATAIRSTKASVTPAS